MKANLKKYLLNSITVPGIMLFIASSVFSIKEPYYLMLTAAQLVFVPIMLQLIIGIKRTYVGLIWITMLSIFLLHFVSNSTIQISLAVIYLVFTFIVAIYGAKRFFHRGFTNWAEISIDVGMMYLFIGGLWFFAFIAEINTGFSPLITWLTAIHFHYSAFLFPVSLGFFGRLHQSKWYRICVPIILIGPILVAIGITFWPFLEVISVLLYIFAIYTLIILAFQTVFINKLQGAFIRLSFSSLGITILFSLLYALNSAFGKWGVSIDFMLTFHGLVNSVLFGFIGVLGWVMSPPKTKQAKWDFPVSQIRGHVKGEGEPVVGLVDDLSEYLDIKGIPSTIVHFYEQTEKYQLFASTKWAIWFKPLAVCYKYISNHMQQLNLPISSEKVEMTGSIQAVSPIIDGRNNPRVWNRYIGNDSIFKAIYSHHKTKDRTFMNISLPLPFSAMIGILQLDEMDGALLLSSEGESDSGIYLAVGKYVFKLPLSESFLIKDSKNNMLTATHKMKIFGMPFLNIQYTMSLKQ
ncbi:YndJ family protein [Fictibacillus sp. 5RED26]|uniref:YndJ family protein n=1 Tax=Fictibacillus sp. 5RED26 TaxID=2745876 RepID=UPI0018CE0CCE|nr:YndJ family protein [Fictibacillus sp. 5RED26]MBH0156926.1 YndJ family protein [Fictibacillus sp. 5RED26]